MADEDFDLIKNELFPWVDARPDLVELFRSSGDFGNRACSAFALARAAEQTPAEIFPLIEAAAVAYRTDPAAALKMLEDFIMRQAPTAPLPDSIERELARTERVNHLQKGSFENFLLMDDDHFSEIITQLVQYQLKNNPKENFRTQIELEADYLSLIEFMLSLAGQGKLIFHETTKEPHFSKPIGEILNQAMLSQLKGFIEQHRPRTKEILNQFL